MGRSIAIVNPVKHLPSKINELQRGRKCRTLSSRPLSRTPRVKRIAGLVNAVGVSGSNVELQSSIKDNLEKELVGENRGIFGVKVAKKETILSLLSQLEDCSPLKAPTEHLDAVSGEWILLFSTISILGSRRTKLGLRSFISLGDFVQTIDIKESTAVNRVNFSVAGFDALMGSLTISATYEAVSPNRVSIKYEQSTMVPDKLLKLFEKNYDLLLSIFNPEGWLDITYVDDTHRIGRDDKGNMFYLRRK